MSFPIDLVDQNKWWRNKTAIQSDKDIANLRRSKIKWEPRMKHFFDWDKDAVYTLRGPRQVGKTTLVKTMIAERLKTTDPKNVFYYTCNLVDSPKVLAEIVSTYCDSVRIAGKRAYVFLDEVSSVKDWQNGVKHLADVGKLANVTMVLTGSHSIDVKRNAERLPGRRGTSSQTLDKIMLPMKFAEYVESVNPQLASDIMGPVLLSAEARKGIFGSLLKGEVKEIVKEIVLYSKELQQLFSDYLMTGGIPRVVNEYKVNNEIGEGIYKTYVDSVLGDLQRWGKRETYVRQVVGRILDTQGTPVGWNTMRNGTDIASHATVAEYVDYITDTFALLYLYRLDSNRGSPAYEKEKKLFFEDPFFFHSLRAWCKGLAPFQMCVDYMREERNVACLVESVVADHLVRLSYAFSKQKQLFDYQTSLFYWRSNKSREVDFVLKDSTLTYMAIELKYQRSITRDDKFGIIDFAKATGSKRAGILLSRNELREESNAVVIPVWAFLLLV